MPASNQALTMNILSPIVFLEKEVRKTLIRDKESR